MLRRILTTEMISCVTGVQYRLEKHDCVLTMALTAFVNSIRVVTAADASAMGNNTLSPILSGVCVAMAVKIRLHGTILPNGGESMKLYTC